MADHDHLETYSRTGDGRAFEALARRYSGLVYASALARTGSPEAAEEIVQEVFCKLARWTGRLKDNQALSAWLYRVTSNESADYLRKESRRRRTMKDYQDHEEASALEHETENESVPHLYAALDDLNETDRKLLLFRFFDKESYRDIAAKLNKSEPACRKRVERALTKLANLLRSRGVTASMAGLSAALTTQFSKAAPIGIVNAATKAAIGSAPITLTSTIQFMALSQSKGALLGTVVLWLVVSGTGIWLGWEHRRHIEKATVMSAQSGNTVVAGEPVDGETASPLQSSNETLERLRFLIRSPQAEGRLLEFELALGQLNLSQLENIAQYTRGKLVYADEEDLAMATALLQKMIVIDPNAAFAFAEELGSWKNDALPKVLAAWARADREAALEWISTSDSRLRSRAFRSVLEMIGETDRKAAIALFREGVANGVLPANAWDADDFFRAWVKEDPITAIEEALALREFSKKDAAVINAMTAWAKFDPDAAHDWLNRREMDESLRNRLTIDYVDGLAEVDPERAANFVLEIADKDTQESAALYALRDWTAVSFSDAENWISTIEDSQKRQRFEITLMRATRERGNREEAIAYGVAKYGEHWRFHHELYLTTGSIVVEDPAAAVPWILETFPEGLHQSLLAQVSHTTRGINPSQAHNFLDLIEDPVERARHYESAGDHWAREDVEAARDWANSLRDSPDRDRALAGVAKSWIQSGPGEFSEWVSDLEHSPLRDSMAARYVGKMSVSNHLDAVRMAQSIQHPQARDHSMEYALGQWMQRDPDAARALIETTDALSESTRWRLLERRYSNIRYPIQ